MQIAAIDIDLIPLPAVTPAFVWRRGLRGSHGPRTTAVLRITTEDGAIGEAYHEWSGPMLADIVDRVLRDELVGERADRREWLWHRLWELDRTDEFPIWLIGVVDVALWDLEGRVRGVPVHRLLGTYREEIPACASTTTFATVAVFSWALLEPSEGTFDFGWLDEVLSLLHAGGIAVDLATATASPQATFKLSHATSTWASSRFYSHTIVGPLSIEARTS